jgi:hypothetical protein
MPLESSLVVRFERRSLIKAGTRKGKMPNQHTTTTIKIQTVILSNLRDRRDSGVINPIGTAKHKTTNRTRPAAIQQTGAIEANTSLNLIVASMEIRRKGRT